MVGDPGEEIWLERIRHHHFRIHENPADPAITVVGMIIHHAGDHYILDGRTVYLIVDATNTIRPEIHIKLNVYGSDYEYYCRRLIEAQAQPILDEASTRFTFKE